MNKFFYPLLLGAAIMLAPDANAYEGVTWDKRWNKQTHQYESSTNENYAKDWMGDLPDNLFVAHLSIPGAHDAATGDMNTKSASTQDARIEEMLDRGVRAFDFRPGWNSNTLYCYHSDYRTNYTFENAMSLITNFLEAHPTEFVFFHLFPGNVESGSSSASAFTAALETMFNSTLADRVIPFRPDLKVSEVHGKIIVFQRHKLGFVNIPAAGYTDWWQENFYYDGKKNKLESPNYLTMYQRGTPSKRTTLAVQDCSSTSNNLEDKRLDCLALLDWAANRVTPNDGFKANGSFTPRWAINFTSRGISRSSYLESTRTMNWAVIDWLNNHSGEGPLGIILSDGILRNSMSQGLSNYTTNGAELIYKIIQNNFDGGDNAPVVRFAIDETLDWDAPAVFIRNARSGKYLASSRNWATAVGADDCGVQIRIVKEDDGTVSLRTPLTGEAQGKPAGLGTNGFMDNHDDIAHFYMEPITGTPYYTFTMKDTNNKICCTGDASGWAGPFVQEMVEISSNPEFFGENNINTYWEVLTLDEIISEAEEWGESNNRTTDEFFLSMTMPEGHVYCWDETNHLWGDNLSSSSDGGSYTDQWGNRGGGANDLVIMRIANESWATNNAFEWTRTINDVPNGNYRIEINMATIHYNAATADGFTFTINGVEYKDRIHQIDSSFNNGDISTGSGASYFSQNPSNVKVSIENVKVSNGKLVFRIARNAFNGASALFMDDWKIIYLGKDKTEIEMTFPMYYNTLMLPFDVAELPENLHAFIPQEEHVSTLQTDKPIYEADGKVYSYHLVTLNEPITDGIKANTPYIIVNDNGYILEGDATAVNASAPKAKAPRKANAVDSRTYKFYGYPNEDEATEGILTGVHEDTTLDSEHYTLDQATAFQAFFMNGETSDIEAHRAYIDIYNLAEDTAVEHPIIVFNAQPNPLTGVETVAAEADADAPAVYYNLQGVRVENPQQGIFIRRQGTKIEKVAL